MLKFELIKNKENNNNPVIIFIHGYGANRFDLLGLNKLFPKYHCISLEAPFQLAFNQSCWYNIYWDGDVKSINVEEAKYSKNAIINFIDETLPTLDISYDKDKVELLGFSQGGILSYAVASETDLHKIFALSSYFDSQISDINGLNRDNLSIFACHGRTDEVIPFKFAEDTKNSISKFNLKNYTFKEHPEGHWIPQNIINEIGKWNNETD